MASSSSLYADPSLLESDRYAPIGSDAKPIKTPSNMGPTAKKLYIGLAVGAAVILGIVILVTVLEARKKIKSQAESSLPPPFVPRTH